MSIAAILTCFNRREKTLACLRSLLAIVPQCEVYLTDDGSTDGTAQAVAREFPGVHIVAGTGNLFWNRGMYVAWQEARKSDYDYYLWLNDDLELYPTFFDELMECNRLGGGYCVVSGLIEDISAPGRILYGGSDAKKVLLGECDTPQEIMFMNGNVVLVPRSVVEAIGILDPVLHHDLGDVDYGLTARENGIKVLSTRKAVAAGYANNFCRVRKWGVTMKQRFKKLHSPLGSNPRLNYYFRKKHFGWAKAVSFVSYVYVLNILPDAVVTRIWGDTYRDK